EASGHLGARHRMEHVQLLHPDDLPRLARLRVVASMQPIHATSDRDIAERYWGGRSRYAYAWRSLLDHGAVLAFGSAAPVATPVPGSRARRRPRPPAWWVPRRWVPRRRVPPRPPSRSRTPGTRRLPDRVAPYCGVPSPNRTGDREPSEGIPWEGAALPCIGWGPSAGASSPAPRSPHPGGSAHARIPPSPLTVARPGTGRSNLGSCGYFA